MTWKSVFSHLNYLPTYLPFLAFISFCACALSARSKSDHPTLLNGAGNGVFVTGADAPRGTLLALYAGVSRYQLSPWQNFNLLSCLTVFLFRCLKENPTRQVDPSTKLQQKSSWGYRHCWPPKSHQNSQYHRNLRVYHPQHHSPPKK